MWSRFLDGLRSDDRMHAEGAEIEGRWVAAAAA